MGTTAKADGVPRVMQVQRISRIAAAALAGAVLLGAAPFSEPFGADALFMAARTARSQSGYAHYSVYATVTRFRRGGHLVVSTWDTVEDMRRRLVHARTLPRQEAAHPHVPHGINIGVGGLGHSGHLEPGEMPPKGQIVSKEPTNDPIGQLSFAVDQDFGLALNAPAIGATADMSQVSASVSTLPYIGRVGNVARTYEVTDLGDVADGGVVQHHLGLRPLRDPRRYRLRELWTDAKTSLPVRAIVAGIGNRAPLQDARWRIDFIQIEGGTYLQRETALAPLESDGGRLDDVTIAFEELRPTNRLTPFEALGLGGDVGITDP
jgi:hypothetical protein